MKCNILYTTEEIMEIQAQKGKPLELLIDHVVEKLFKCKAYTGTVYNFVLKKGGTKQDSMDVIQDSLIVLVKTLTRGTFKGKSSIENYTYGISKKLWLNKLKTYRHKHVVSIESEGKNDEMVEGTPLLDLETLERKKILWENLNKLGQICIKALELMALSFSHHEIAEEMGWTVERSRKHRSKCLEKLRNELRKDGRL